MPKKLYVGNLNYAVTNEELKELFSAHGEVASVNVIEGKGFGFVEMANDADADKIKETLNGSDYKGRALRIADARPPREGGGGGRDRGGFGGGGYGGGGRGGYGGGGRDRY